MKKKKNNNNNSDLFDIRKRKISSVKSEIIVEMFICVTFNLIILFNQCEFE